MPSRGYRHYLLSRSQLYVGTGAVMPMSGLQARHSRRRPIDNPEGCPLFPSVEAALTIGPIPHHAE